MPAKKEDLPSTLERSPDKVQRTYEKTLDSAHDTYGDEERAHRTAWASVKNVAEKQGDHWEPKGESGDADDEPTKSELYEQAKDRDIPGRSEMSKDELKAAVDKAS